MAIARLVRSDPICIDFGRGLKTKGEIQMTIDCESRANDIEFAIPKLHLELPEGYVGPGKTE